jgi:hypothetical protein
MVFLDKSKSLQCAIRICLACFLISCIDDATLDSQQGDSGQLLDADGSVAELDDHADSAICTLPAISAKARLQFKKVNLIQNDFSAALDLETSQLCNELGLYSCTTVAHKVVLGGVDAYRLGINVPQEANIITPLAVDRVALAGCIQRVDLDFNDSAAATIFKNLVLNGTSFTDIDDTSVQSSIINLYRKILTRDPSATEVAHLKSLYPDVLASSSSAARDWAVASCFAVITSSENLFY